MRHEDGVNARDVAAAYPQLLPAREERTADEAIDELGF
jgi:hypothetical protein